MLAKRIIPCLDVAGGRVVKGTSFVQLRDSGDPVELAHLYYQEGADEVVMLDITATAEGRHTVTDIVENISENVFVPLAVGGGIRSIDDVRRLLLSGADKVCINTAALLNPTLVSKSADKFGSQSIVVAIDAKRIGRAKQAQWEVYICAGQRATGTEATAWAKRAVELGAGEILLTSNTTPDFMPAIQKAKAIITNEGGLTCHAAIISRELKIPRFRTLRDRILNHNSI